MLESSPVRHPILLLLAVAGVALFFELGSLDLTEPSEGRYAEIGRAMADSGDYVTPRLNGIKHFEKPPFAYWMVALGVKMFGADELGARCLAALFGVGIVLLTFFIGRRLWDSDTGLLAGLLLLATPEFFGVARSITTDVFLAFWATAAIGCFLRWRSDPARPAAWRWGYFAMVGMGFLTKGPVVLVSGVLPVLVALAWQRDWATLRELRWVRGLLFSFAFLAPWLLLLERGTPGTVGFMVHRIVAAVGTAEEFHGEPFWYYLPVVLVGCIPCTPVLPAFWRRFVRGGNDPNARFLTAWWITLLVGFSLAASKLLTYILPITVPLALQAARLWRECLRAPAGEPLPLPLRVGIWSLLGFFAIGVVGIPIALSLDPLPGFRPDLDTLRSLASSRSSGIALAAFLAVLVPIAAWLLVRRRHRALLAALLVLHLGVQSLGLVVWKDLEADINTLGPMARALATEFRPGDTVVSYQCFPRSLGFTLGRPVPTIDYDKRDVRLVKDEPETRDLLRFGRAELLRVLQGPGRAFVVTRFRYWWNDAELRASCREVYRSGGLVTIIPKSQKLSTE